MTVVRIVAGVVALVVAVPCLASSAGWVYLAGELLLVVGLILAVGPAVRGWAE